MKKKQFLLFFWSAILLGSTTLLIGCGKKGLPRPPEGSTYSYPAQYPPEE